ncbi:putative reverse transcriptase domain-containing protein, partial [Tanacetum coccineum]
MLAQVGNQGNVRNQNGNVVNENVQENVGNVLVNGNRVGCSYKEFLACNPKEYDGKGGVIRMLSREVAVNMSWNDFKFMMIEEFCPSYEMQKLETKVGRLRGEFGKDKNGKDDNKRTRTGNAFTSTANPGRGNQGNQARGKAFMLGADEACQDLNIVMGIEPNELGFRYEIEIDSGQLVEIDKVIKGCKLENEGHVFDIDLIPFGHGSFDVIIGMDWLSNHKAEIIYHEKVVRIPLLDGK